MKEWLCLTCQMERALRASESVEPPLMKPQASPNKVSAAANQKKDIISTQKAEMPDKNEKDSPTPGATQKKEEIKPPLQMDKTQTKEEKIGSPPTNKVPASAASLTKESTTVVTDLNKQLPAQVPPVNTDSEISLQKKKDVIAPSSPETKDVLEDKEKNAGKVQKSSSVTPLPAQPANQDSGDFPSFGSPKSQRAASQTTEVVTGKMLGFGSSLFSSASNLITSAVQEARTTPPSSRKMSAPAQVSDKMSATQISPKSSPPVSPRIASAKDAKLPATQEKIQDQPQQSKASPSEQAKVDSGPSEPVKPEASKAAPKVGQSTCPLCKAELNMGSNDPPNYNTCTECRTCVCNKCGFNPMPNATEVNN